MMRLPLAISLGVLAVAAPTRVPGQEPAPSADEPKREARSSDSSQATPFPQGYRNQDALEAALKEVAAANSDLLRIESLAKSTEGRDVWLATIGRDREEGEPARPAILLVANLEADHLVGSEVAIELIDRLVRALADPGDEADEVATSLERFTFHIVPRLNPDGAERLLGATRLPFRSNLRPTDTDRDRHDDEDGPNDLDGDGVITTMRVRDRAASLIPHKDDPRILQPAEASKGQRAVYSEYVEGTDDDEDGALNEDPPGGVDLHRNWPHRWAEFDRSAGPTPLSEPETRALARFAFDHPEIVAVLVYGLNDTIRDEPKKDSSGLDPADLPYFVALSNLYKEAREKSLKGLDVPVSIEPTPADDTPTPDAGPIVTAPVSALKPLSNDGSNDGSLAAWAYQQYGVVGLGMTLWDGPSFPEELAEGVPKPPDDTEARRLYWNDHVLGGRGFVPFAPFEHPTLGTVQIGGWKPGVRLNPPAERIPALADVQWTLLTGLAKRLPRVEITRADSRSLGGRLFEITAVVENPAFLPTTLAQGVKTRTAGPLRIRLDHEGARLLAGDALTRVDSLDGSGAHRELRWLIEAPESVRSVRVVAESPKLGRVVRTIELNTETEPRQ